MKKTVYITLRLKVFLAIVVGVLFVFSILILISMKSDITTSASVGSNNPVIIVDAGHGGEDGGTQSSSGIIEKDINLEIAEKVNSILMSLGYDTIMIRSDDTLIYDSDCDTIREKKVSDIHNRMTVIEENPNSIFLSIHQNYYIESKYYGAQVFYSPNNDESKVIAELLQNSIIANIQPDNTRKIKESGSEIYLLYHSETPAVMVECGFLSNAGEAQLLSDKEYQKKMSLAIAAGITEYFNKF